MKCSLLPIIIMLTVRVLALLSTVVMGQVLPWIKPAQLNRGLPSSAEIFTLNTSSSPFASKLTGVFARFDMSDQNLQFKVVSTSEGIPPKTPIQFANDDSKLVYASLNGGFFDMVHNFSVSFIAQNSKVLAKNTINEAADHFPTVGAFGLKDKSFSAEWVYSYDPNMTTYRFKNPNPVPGPVAKKSAGELWGVEEGIGAGPILMKSGFVVSSNVENFNMNAFVNFRHPRSAICVDINNKLLLLAIDGRYDGSDGVTLPELAEIMQLLDCYDALNLDGGGSTLLYANNKVVNRPSDGTGPRPVVSAVLIRDKVKVKQPHDHILDLINHGN